jgi:prefoldin subunit 5
MISEENYRILNRQLETLETQVEILQRQLLALGKAIPNEVFIRVTRAYSNIESARTYLYNKIGKKYE